MRAPMRPRRAELRSSVAKTDIATAVACPRAAGRAFCTQQKPGQKRKKRRQPTDLRRVGLGIGELS